MNKLLTLLALLCFYNMASAQKNKDKDTTRSLDPAADLYKQALKEIDSSQYKVAIKTLQKAIKKSPKYADAFNKMAYCKLQLKDYRGASKDLESSLEIMPDNFDCIKFLGRILYLDQRYEEAKKKYEDAYKINGNDHELIFYMGELRAAGKDVKGAIDVFTQVLELKETYAPALIQRGILKYKQKEFNYAIKDITDGMKWAKQGEITLEAYETRAMSYFEVGRFKEAITDFNKVLELDPKHENGYIYRGASKINLNDNSGAIEDLTKAIDINGKSHIAYNFRGTAKGGLKQYTEAIKDLDKSIDLKFDYASAYINRAAIKMTIKDKKNACKDLEKADRLGSNMAYKLIEKYCSGTN